MTLGYVIVYVPDVAAAVSFYEDAFGLARGFVHEAGDYGELATGQTRLAFTSHALGASAVPVAYAPLAPDRPPAGIELTIVADDVPAAFRRAVDAGATPLTDPHDTSWGQTVAYVRDLVGTLVGIASPMPG